MKNDYQAESDAGTLQRAAEVHADPKRHKAAHNQLSKQVETTKAAHKASKKAMHKKVKAGLSKAFPEGSKKEEAAESPQQEAAEGGM